jgi:two-component system sensor histidine kinase ChvG
MALASDISGSARREKQEAELVLGEDWVAAPAASDTALRERRSRATLAINRSPLARKIVMFNVLALIVLVAGILYLSPARESLVEQHAHELVAEARLVADVFEVQLPEGAPVNIAAGDGLDVDRTIDALDLPLGVEVYVYDTTGARLASSEGRPRPDTPEVVGLSDDARSTVITDLLTGAWQRVDDLFAPDGTSETGPTPLAGVETLVEEGLAGRTATDSLRLSDGMSAYRVATPIRQDDAPIGVLVLTSAGGEIDALVRGEREQVLQMFVIALLVSIGLSLILASTIANPLSDLAAAAEIGRDRNARRKNPSRVRIPDLSGRPDEIGRLSGALRGMVAALYDRIDANEQFAADVAHEIKNPLASLRSAIGTLRVAQRDDQRARLLEVIEHDVQRLDRLVSDISNASRLDSELVKEEEETFDLLSMLQNLTDYLGNEARDKGIEFIADMPSAPITISGLEARLAQVFVNLISNAISFCEEGDAIRVWARRRENRVLVVVEDTGPGIPEQALNKIFNRFYSERPEGQFGNNSGLGLAISKQIVEAHGGVIWAENIRPTDADVTSDPLGARFVVGLPV